MKNIYVLPTDKPSRLYLGKNGNFVFGMMQTSVQSKNDHFCNQHIYITFDKEIKVGDWFLPQGNINPHKLKEYNKINGDLESYNGLCYDISKCKKIILTTDQDLIKDGVQAIDDEFLEWLCNNPSCEEIEIQCRYNFYAGQELTHYKIIIPKEEPKQIYYNTVGIENGVNVVKGQFNTQKEALDLANELNRKFPDLYYDWRETLIKEEPKQETVEEAAERLWFDSSSNSISSKKSFIVGAKWQAERMYSEEEVIKIIYQLHLELQTDKDFTFMKVDEWFEQFKKK